MLIFLVKIWMLGCAAWGPNIHKKHRFGKKIVGLGDKKLSAMLPSSQHKSKYFYHYLFPKQSSYFCLQQMALQDFPPTLCRGVIRTHGRVAPDWDL